MLTILKRIVPRSIRRALRRRQEQHRKTRLFGSLAPLVPSVDAMFDGPASLEEFKANGEEFLGIYKDICALQPHETMLDVGSGIGRKTIPLTTYLNADGHYEGIDITAAGVDWCSSHITPRYPNFQFQRIDVHNGQYNPSGTCKPSEYRFPFDAGSFQFVVLGSVFTHMMPDDVEHYLSEIYRVMAPGRCLISYFLLNDESRRLFNAGRSTLAFQFAGDRYTTISSEVPERAVAFEETFIRSLYERLGFKITRLDYGSWCGRDEFLSYQDLILAVKE